MTHSTDPSPPRHAVAPPPGVAAVRNRLATLAGAYGMALDAATHLHLLDAYTALERANTGPPWTPPADVAVAGTPADLDDLADRVQALIDTAAGHRLQPLDLGVAARRIRDAAATR